jgi:hypothetical protein
VCKARAQAWVVPGCWNLGRGHGMLNRRVQACRKRPTPETSSTLCVHKQCSSCQFWQVKHVAASEMLLLRDAEENGVKMLFPLILWSVAASVARIRSSGPGCICEPMSKQSVRPIAIRGTLRRRVSGCGRPPPRDWRSTFCCRTATRGSGELRQAQKYRIFIMLTVVRCHPPENGGKRNMRGPRRRILQL